MTHKELQEHNRDREFCQIGFVVRDVEAAARQWVDLLKIGPWRFVTLSDESCHDASVLVDGETQEMKPFKFICAICNAGNIQFELIQPVYGPTIYNKFLEEKGEGIHHFKEKIAPESWESQVADYASQDIPVTMRGWYGKAGFAYLGTEAALGFPYELGDNVPNETFPAGSDLHFYPEPDDEK